MTHPTPTSPQASQGVTTLRGRDYAAAIDECKNRKAAAALYWDALHTYGPDGVDWAQVNGAILNRWSRSALIWIKKQAWKEEQPR